MKRPKVPHEKQKTAHYAPMPLEKLLVAAKGINLRKLHAWVYFNWYEWVNHPEYLSIVTLKRVSEKKIFLFCAYRGEHPQKCTIEISWVEDQKPLSWAETTTGFVNG